MEVRVAPPASAGSRVGVVVPRHGQTAVARNRVKRRLREIVRVERIGRRTSSAGDIVVYAFPGAYVAATAALRVELLALCDQAGF